MKIAYYYKTGREQTRLTEFLGTQGVVWCHSREQLANTPCGNILGCITIGDKGASYSSKQYYISKGYAIVPVSSMEFPVEKVIVGGHEAKDITLNSATVGCTKVSKKELEALLKAMETA